MELELDAISPALPDEWIKRLFTRLQSIYGNRMETMWGGADPDDHRQTWAEALLRFDGADIREALVATRAAYRDYPPTLPQFVALCQDAKSRRAQNSVKLEAPRTAMPDKVKAQLRAFVAGHKAAH